MLDVSVATVQARLEPGAGVAVSRVEPRHDAAEISRKSNSLYHAALEVPAAERSAFLTSACDGDPTLLREVESLLAANDEAGDFIAHSGPRGRRGAGSPTPNGGAAHWRPDRRLRRRQPARPRRHGRGLPRARHAARTQGRAEAAASGAHRTTPTSTRRFEQEARAASSLNHPNIVTIYEIGEFDDRRFLAMEFVEGQSLCRAGGRPARRSTRWRASAPSSRRRSPTAHAAGIVHRDIKPENVMLRADGYVKVLDFGLARLLPAAPHVRVATAERHRREHDPRHAALHVAGAGPRRERGHARVTCFRSASSCTSSPPARIRSRPIRRSGMLHAIASRDTPNPMQRVPHLPARSSGCCFACWRSRKPSVRRRPRSNASCWSIVAERRRRRSTAHVSRQRPRRRAAHAAAAADAVAGAQRGDGSGHRHAAQPRRASA